MHGTALQHQVRPPGYGTQSRGPLTRQNIHSTHEDRRHTPSHTRFRIEILPHTANRTLYAARHSKRPVTLQEPEVDFDKASAETTARPDTVSLRQKSQFIDQTGQITTYPHTAMLTTQARASTPHTARPHHTHPSLRHTPLTDIHRTTSHALLRWIHGSSNWKWSDCSRRERLQIATDSRQLISSVFTIYTLLVHVPYSVLRLGFRPLQDFPSTLPSRHFSDAQNHPLRWQ